MLDTVVMTRIVCLEWIGRDPHRLRISEGTELKRRKTDRREMAQFIWTLVVGLAVVIAALQDTRAVFKPPAEITSTMGISAPGRAPSSTEEPAIPAPRASELLRAR